MVHNAASDLQKTWSLSYIIYDYLATLFVFKQLHKLDIHQFSKHFGKYNASIPNKNIETYNQKSTINTFRVSQGEDMVSIINCKILNILGINWIAY